MCKAKAKENKLVPSFAGEYSENDCCDVEVKISYEILWAL